MHVDETDLDRLAQCLRARIAEGRYSEARYALVEYCRLLRRIAAGFSPGDPGLLRLEIAWRQLRDQTQRSLLAGRAHAEARLARLARRRSSYEEPPDTHPTWSCSG